MGISRETRNTAELLTQRKITLDEQIEQFIYDAYNMYAQFLHENGLDGDVIYNGKTVGKLKVSCNPDALYTDYSLVRFYPDKSAYYDWDIIDVGDYDFEKNCHRILEYFKPCKRKKTMKRG